MLPHKEFLIYMYIVCLDLESILTPEIWISVAKKTKIKELRLTTRDVPDYDALMKRRLKILKIHNIKLKDIQKVIRGIKPFRGTLKFLDWLREKSQVIILTDSFYEFTRPLAEKLSYPVIFCNSLEVDKNGFIKNYKLRQKDGKKKSVMALKSLGFKVIAVGDSYNDINMLKMADLGILFNAPTEVKKDFPQFTTVDDYRGLKLILEKHLLKSDIGKKMKQYATKN